MKVYLGFTVAGSRSSIEAAKKILDVLESLGHQVLTSHLVGENAWEADRRVAPQKIFARDMDWLAPRSNREEDHPFFRTGRGAQDFTPDHREYPPKLHPSSVLRP